MTVARGVALLGATGSIGRQTLDVLRRSGEEFSLDSVAAGRVHVTELIAIAREFDVRRVGVAHADDVEHVHESLGGRVEVVVGEGGLAELAARSEIVVNAVVGFAGLPVTVAALAAGRRLALANKESFIAAAPLARRLAATPGAEVLPIDSEHCAIHQCLASSNAPGHPDVRRLILTASGGPFRGWSREDLEGATRESALRHPTWSMGPKITIDSSTLMNKGLEVLEASALFGIEVGRVDVVIHPQSVVHSMVEYLDGSLIAQLSMPDMRLPIAYCLGYPVRLDHAWGAIDFTSSHTLSFEPPDRTAFPAIDLAYHAASLGDAGPAWLSAANEVAVESFLHDEIRWADIVPVVSTTLERFEDGPLNSVEDVVAHDAAARREARKVIGARA